MSLLDLPREVVPRICSSSQELVALSQVNRGLSELLYEETIHARVNKAVKKACKYLAPSPYFEFHTIQHSDLYKRDVRKFLKENKIEEAIGVLTNVTTCWRKAGFTKEQLEQLKSEQEELMLLSGSEKIQRLRQNPTRADFYAITFEVYDAISKVADIHLSMVYAMEFCHIAWPPYHTRYTNVLNHVLKDIAETDPQLKRVSILINYVVHSGLFNKEDSETILGSFADSLTDQGFSDEAEEVIRKILDPENKQIRRANIAFFLSAAATAK